MINNILLAVSYNLKKNFKVSKTHMNIKNIDISKVVTECGDDFIFDLMGIQNFNNSTSPMRHYFDFIRNNAQKIKGDILEFGCYKGGSLLATAILLKKLKINKIVYGFDSFDGFPTLHKYDQFKYLKKNKKIYFNHLIFKKIREFTLGKRINELNISQSLDFSDYSINALKKKIKFLKLDNIKLIKGNFDETVPKFFSNFKKKIFCVNIDCDLYESYKVVLPPSYKILSKGGYIHLDEYFGYSFPGAKIFCDEFAKSQNLRIKKNNTRKYEFQRFYIKK